MALPSQFVIPAVVVVLLSPRQFAVLINSVEGEFDVKIDRSRRWGRKKYLTLITESQRIIFKLFNGFLPF